MTRENITLKSIRNDGETQARVAISEDLVAEYRQVLADGGELDPITLFFDSTDYWVGDGHHRLLAYIADDRASIPAEVRQGTQRDAQHYALFWANKKHGKPRTNADKRNIVVKALADPEWSKWSDRRIADEAGLSHPFVAKVRAELTGNVSSERTYTTKHGIEATMDTSNIGKGKKGEKAAAAPAPSPAPARSSDRQAASSPVSDAGVTGSSPVPSAPPPATAVQARAAERAAIAEEAHGDFDPLAELEATQRKLEVAEKLIEVMQADDQKAETRKALLRAEHAERRQGELMDSAKKSQDREKWTHRQLMRCGKAVGEEDPSRIAATVEAFTRAFKLEKPATVPA